MTWEYIAGFFDGEGSVSPSGSRTGLHIQLVQKTRPVLDAIHLFLSSHGVACRLHRNNSHPARMYSLHVTGAVSLLAFLSGVRPFVIVKKQSVEDGLRLLRLFPPLSLATAQRLSWESRRAAHGWDHPLTVGGETHG